MTVNGMMMLSKVFLGMMIFFLIAAIVVFFALDVRKAWCILTGKKPPVNQKKSDFSKAENKNNRAKEYMDRVPKKEKVIKDAGEDATEVLTEVMEATTLLQPNESINNNYEGYHPTTVLMDNMGETTVLAEAEGETTVLAQQQDNSNDIVMDITFIHTEITL